METSSKVTRIESDKFYFMHSLGMDEERASVHAQNIETLRERLHEGITHFRFIKVDGSVREAYGTLNATIYGEANAPKGEGSRKQSEGQLSYFDTEKQAWRCLKKANLMEIL